MGVSNILEAKKFALYFDNLFFHRQYLGLEITVFSHRTYWLNFEYFNKFGEEDKKSKLF